jgi:hypothetical protein
MDGNHKPGTINFPPDGYKVQYPGNNNMITTPITFRATGTVSDSLRICPFATLVPMDFFGPAQQQFGFSTTPEDDTNLLAFMDTDRDSQKRNDGSFPGSDQTYETFVLTGCAFTQINKNQSNYVTDDGFYTMKANFFTV